MTTKPLDTDNIATAHHKIRLAAIETAIDALGKLRGEHGFNSAALPGYINDARDALWRAYHAEKERGAHSSPDTTPYHGG